VTLILTVDLGTTSTKALLWSPDGMMASAAVSVSTTHAKPGWAEQDAGDWWESVVAATSQVPEARAGVDAIGLSGARETFVPVTSALEPLGPALLWSDRRAAAEAETLCADHGGQDALHQRVGIIVDAGAMVAKVAWLAGHDPARLESARWLLSPRDLVAAQLTGSVVTDASMASKTGFAAISGGRAAGFAALAADRLPPVLASNAIVGPVTPERARSLGISPGTPVVIGAGDRACEVIVTGATPLAPMVSWGTTANVSIPVEPRPHPLPAGAALTGGAFGGWMLEAGLSASGAAMAWLAAIAGITPEGLMAEVTLSEPGARGVIALPWFNGARAPWWAPGARAAFVGLSAAHGRADLARAIVEGVALDVDRSLAVLAPASTAVYAAGGGSAGSVWRHVLAAVTSRSVIRRAVPDAAGVGACLLAADAIGAASSFPLDRINPVAGRDEPDPDLVQAYAALRGREDLVANTLARLDFD
jgi:xylulokinase